MEPIALSTNKYLLLVEDGMYYGFKNGKHMQKYFEELESGKEDKKIEIIKYSNTLINIKIAKTIYAVLAPVSIKEIKFIKHIIKYFLSLVFDDCFQCKELLLPVLSR